MRVKKKTEKKKKMTNNCHLFFIIMRSKIDIMPYIIPDKMQSITIAVITKSSLKICPPYTKRYPRPALLDKYSPMITPTQAMPKLIFRVATKLGRVAGKISLVRI